MSQPLEFVVQSLSGVPISAIPCDWRNLQLLKLRATWNG